MKKKILLTGGNGFIGRNLTERLTGKYEIFSPSHLELDLIDTEAVNNYLSKYGQFDILLHAATIGGKRSEKEMLDVVQTNERVV